MNVYGLTGAAHAGKDTVALLVKNRNPDVLVLSFAQPLKEGLHAMLGLDWRHTDGDLKEVPLPEFGGVTPRVLMQTLGTEWGRQTVDGDIWVTRAMAIAAKHPGPVLFTDVRFENEARAIFEAGGKLYRVLRPGHDNGVPAHASEAGISGQWVYGTIWNDGTLLDLEMRVLREMDGLCRCR